MMKRGLVAVLVAAMLVTSVNPVGVYAAAPETVQTEEIETTAETDGGLITEPAAEQETVTEPGDEQEASAQPGDEGKTEDGDEKTEAPLDDLSDGTISDGAEDKDPEQDVADDAAEPVSGEADDQAAADEIVDEEEQISFEEDLFETDNSFAFFSGGDGGIDTPYLIATSDDWLDFKKVLKNNTASSDKVYYKLTADMDFSKVDAAWNLSDQEMTFVGVLDGNGHKISNLRLSDAYATLDTLGFVNKNYGTIKNLTIENATVEYGKNVSSLNKSRSIGVFAGISTGTIEHCTLTGTVSITGKLAYTGGFVGKMPSGTLDTCKNLATDFSLETVYYNSMATGGIVGIAGKTSGTETVIKDCQMGGEDGKSTFRGAIVHVGGIAGCVEQKNTSVTGCKNYAGITCGEDSTTSIRLGGIVGDGGCSMQNCTNYGTLEGPRSSSIGGICWSSSNQVSGCINKGTLRGGAVAGISYNAYAGSCITGCANFGKLIHDQTYGGTLQIGGIAAALTGGTIENCYNCGKMENAAGELYSGRFGGIAGGIDPNAADTVISKCYSVGALIDDSSFTKKGSGGIVGTVAARTPYTTGAITLADCYADSVILAQDATDEVVVSKCYQKTSAELQDQSTYAGWDFTDIWTMGTGAYKYPVLKDMEKPESMPEAPGDPSGPNVPGGSEDVVKSDYTVEFDSRNGEEPVKKSFAAGTKIKKTDAPAAQLAGYVLRGWYTEDACVNLWDFENGTVWYDMTLYAGWTAKDDEDSVPATDQLVDGSADKLWMAKLGSYVYTGAAIKPEVQVYYGTRKLRAGTDYTVRYTNNTKAGTAGVQVTGKGIFKSSAPLSTTFTINRRNIGSSIVTKIFTNAYAFNSKNTKNPAIVFKAVYGTKTLKNKTDYKLTVCSADGSETTDYHAVGEYTLKVEGNGNYTGTYIAKFKVVDGTPVSKLKVKKIPAQKYDGGKALTPKPEIKSGKTILTEGTDYSLTYKNNTEIGTASVIITGKGDYFGSRAVNFSIAGLPLKKAKFAGWKNSLEYNGTYQEQYATLTYGSGNSKVTLLDNDNLPEDYTGTGDYTVVSYENNKYVGKATVTYKGMGKYSGTVKKTFKITPCDIRNWPTDSLVTTGNIETGEGFDVSFMDWRINDKLLTNGVDYTYTRKKSKNTITVTVKGKGNYKGKFVQKYIVASEALNLGFSPDDFKVADVSLLQVNSVKQISERLEAIHEGDGDYRYQLKGDDMDYHYYDGIKKLKEEDICSLAYKNRTFLSYTRNGDLSLTPILLKSSTGKPDTETKAPCVQVPAGYDSGDTIDAIKAIIEAAPTDGKSYAVRTTEHGRVSIKATPFGLEGLKVNYYNLSIIFEELDGCMVLFKYDVDSGKILTSYIEKKSDYSNDK